MNLPECWKPAIVYRLAGVLRNVARLGLSPDGIAKSARANVQPRRREIPLCAILLVHFVMIYLER
jgi:hypothetical protein